MTRSLMLALAAVRVLAGADLDWPAYGGGAAGIRSCPLRQITRSTFARLHVAWTYDTQDGAGDRSTQPILVHGVLYGVTPTHKAVAVAGVTGLLLWAFDPGIRRRGPNRTVVGWLSRGERRLFVVVQSFV